MKCISRIDQPDSQAVVEKEDQNESNLEPTTILTTNNQSFVYGEHVAGIWYDDDKCKYTWHLGVVDGMEGERVTVSYMKMSDRKGRNWLFPEEADVHATSIDQIIVRNIQVTYSMTAIIRCEISQETLHHIEACFTKSQ